MFLAKHINGFLAQLDGSSEVSLPNVMARHNAKGEDNVGRLYRPHCQFGLGHSQDQCGDQPPGALKQM